MPILKSLTASLFIAALVACGQAPDLPPSDSMELPSFFDERAALTADQPATQNVRTAAISVFAVTGAVQLALLAPRAIVFGLLSTPASRDGDAWVWTKNFPLLGIEGTLRGSLDGGTLNTSTSVTGKREGIDLDNFEWFTGAHQATDGQWIFNSTSETGVLTIDWERLSATDKTISFTNTSSDVDKSGDSVTYDLNGTAASMTIVDMRDENNGNVEATFTVEWDTDAGDGKITTPTQTLCWDTLDNGQVDIPCP